VTCVLVGGDHEHDPSYGAELRAQAKPHENIRFAGQQPNVEEWMQALDVFVFTSVDEPFGMVVIEAMALGKAVVASAAGGPAEVLTRGIDGLVAPVGDAPRLAAEIVRFLDDIELRARAGAAARRRTRDFEISAFARHFGSVVTEAAA